MVVALVLVLRLPRGSTTKRESRGTVSLVYVLAIGIVVEAPIVVVPNPVVLWEVPPLVELPVEGGGKE